MVIKKIKFELTHITAKILTMFLKKVCRTNATSLPGKVIFGLCPDFLTHIRYCCRKKIITVTGTNGKTTTSGLIAHILETSGEKVIHNFEGANMLTGIATSTATQLPLAASADYCVYETDEAYLSKLYDYTKADILVVTNLFRDQLDRYGELAATAQKIKNAILKNAEATIWLNADDPTLASLNINKNTNFFGFENIEFMFEQQNSSTPDETMSCSCGNELMYSKKFYSHVGHYKCSCGFERKQTKYKAYAKIYQTHSEIEIVSNNNTKNIFKVNIPNVYNAYNALAAIVLALEEKISAETIQLALDTYKPAFGRADNRVIDGKNVFFQLIKNPTGATEVLKTVSAYKKNSVLFIAINDHYADGRDVSWLWDTDFEILKTYENKIVLSGIRALDVALRLKYAGVSKENIIIEKNLKKAFNTALCITPQNGTLLAMPSYTVLLTLQKLKQ